MPTFSDTGLFLALEGGEGGGKSTQGRLLVDWLIAEGRSVLATREPGGTPLGARLRELVLDRATGDIAARTEALIYAADKAEHVASVILPALAEGQVVVCDRYVDSTLAYQGAGRQIEVAELEPVARWATLGLRPHLTVVLDIDPEVGLVRAGRVGAGHDRIESEPLAFHRRVRGHFLDLAATNPQHYVVVAADRPAEAVHAEIRAVVAARISEVPA